MTEAKEKLPVFEKEADLCRMFISKLPKEWVAYPETDGFDILLVRKADGVQIGVEAKLRLNAIVVTQAAERRDSYGLTYPGPDYRAVLVPSYAGGDLVSICRLLNITVITVDHPGRRLYGADFRPALPRYADRYTDDSWHEMFPEKRLKLPDWVPDVEAGHPCPVTLTFWKIGAIKLAIIMERKGFLTRRDFRDCNVSMSRWTQCKWIVANGEGGWKKGNYFPDFKGQHPVNYAQIESDYDKWKVKEAVS